MSARQAGDGGGLRSQSFGRDGLVALLTGPIRSSPEPLDRIVQSYDVALGLVEQVDDHGPLEAYGGPVGIVLVVRRVEGGGLDDGVEIAPEAGGAGDGPQPLGLQNLL